MQWKNILDKSPARRYSCSLSDRFGAFEILSCFLLVHQLKQEELLRFGTCNYIQEHHNIILLGATGSGKTNLACALGIPLENLYEPRLQHIYDTVTDLNCPYST